MISDYNKTTSDMILDLVEILKEHISEFDNHIEMIVMYTDILENHRYNLKDDVIEKILEVIEIHRSMLERENLDD